VSSVFEQLETHDLPEHRGTGTWMRHLNSGAEVYHLLNDDPENLFGFIFKTLPADSTGVAHILEHTVLCGSDRFPVKDPFILLVKGSLNTFVNALTYPDKTIYPASSTIPADLFNLMEVYADAVFHPLLRPEFFRQEGHRLQFGEKGLELTGIVYNEMKGVYANHDSVVSEWSARSLLPDTPYAHDSGGDPLEIPDLTYDDFVEFHSTHYHPSNCRIFLYGDIPTEHYLERLDALLSGFTKTRAEFPIPRQPRWSSPKKLEITYPADEDSPTTVTVSWLLDGADTPQEIMASELLDHVLLGTSAAPLRKTLIDAGWGEDLSAASGVQTHLRETVFSAGLRAVASERVNEVADLVLDSLRGIARSGIDPDIVESSLRTVEFRNREIKGGVPNGLRLMGRSIRGWLHGASPDTTLRFRQPFDCLKAEASPGRRFFEELIESQLVDNSHRSVVTVKPDPEQSGRETRELSDRLRAIEAGLSDEDRQRIDNEQHALASLQTPDPPELVATLPFLTKADLPVELESILTEESASAGVPLYIHELPCNGIVYVDLAFNLVGLPPELLPYAAMLSSIMGEVGLPGRSFDLVATDLAMSAGGFSGFCEAAPPVGEPDATTPRMVFRLKALSSTLSEAVDLVSRLLLDATLDNQNRVGDLLREARSDLSGSVLPSGHTFASLRAARRFSVSSHYEEMWRGAEQLLFLAAADDPSEFCRRLTSARDLIIRRDNVVVNVTADTGDHVWERPIGRLVDALPQASTGTRRAVRAVDVPQAEALLVPSDVSYVATATRGAYLGSPDHVYEQILAHILHTGHLWETIRMKGGAYGAGATASGLDGVFDFWSYRDPHIARTIEVFRGSIEHFATHDIAEDELELAIIGVTGRHIRPMSPGRKSIVALRRKLYHITDELRATNHQILLGATPAKVRQTADRLHGSMAQSSIVVVAGRSAIDGAATAIPGLAANQVQLPI
jgi:Zn-dependent M16 (insulinase) family peptidase